MERYADAVEYSDSLKAFKIYDCESSDVKFHPNERLDPFAAFQAQRKSTSFGFDADFEREERTAFPFISNSLSYFS